MDAASRLLLETLRRGNKVLVCGNGGSASEAQHLAAELVGRYKSDRRAFPAIAFTDGPILTSLGNDFGFAGVFSRQVEALGAPGDLLVIFTTSGNSPNVLGALETAKARGLESIAFLGKGGGAAKGLAGCEILVQSPETARVQEAHQFLLHCIMDVVEAAFPGNV